MLAFRCRKGLRNGGVIFPVSGPEAAPKSEKKIRRGAVFRFQGPVSVRRGLALMSWKNRRSEKYRYVESYSSYSRKNSEIETTSCTHSSCSVVFFYDDDRIPRANLPLWLNATTQNCADHLGWHYVQLRATRISDFSLGLGSLH